MRVACVDVGTNSARLLIADVEGAHELKTQAHIHRIIRLGEGVDASGRISVAALDRLATTLNEFAATAARCGAERLIVAGTSASRDAGNEVVKAVYGRTGLTFEILSGSQEAEWSFRGAMSALPQVTGQVITCDIGGGSTEFTFRGNQGMERCSVDLGSVRITERFFKGQPPSARAVGRARDFVQRSLQAVPQEYGGPLVGASDTHRILARLAGPESQALSRQVVAIWLERLLGMSRVEVRALGPNLLAGRDDIFPAAVLICHEAMVHLGREHFAISERGLVHGLAIREQLRLTGTGTIAAKRPA